MAEYREFACDLCGNSAAVEVPHAREYTDNQPIHICTQCGFVYVKQRRSSEQIADDWSEKIFGSGYTAAIPAVKARLTFVAELLNDTLGLKDKRVCEIGAGEGLFLDLVRQKTYGASAFGIEPSLANCKLLGGMGIDHFHGTIEQFDGSRSGKAGEMDIVTIMWTMENCQDCRAMLSGAHRSLRPGGHLLVATGSRILVPFKKPLHQYLSKNPADTHCFRFSANTLRGILAVSGFEVVEVNRYLDSDILCMIARRVEGSQKIPWSGDNYLEVYSFFERWHAETAIYFRKRS